MGESVQGRYVHEKYVQGGVCREVCARGYVQWVCAGRYVQERYVQGCMCMELCAQGPVHMENVLTGSVTDLDCLFHVSAALYICIRHGKAFLTSRRC